MRLPLDWANTLVRFICNDPGPADCRNGTYEGDDSTEQQYQEQVGLLRRRGQKTSAKRSAAQDRRPIGRTGKPRAARLLQSEGKWILIVYRCTS